MPAKYRRGGRWTAFDLRGVYGAKEGKHKLEEGGREGSLARI